MIRTLALDLRDVFCKSYAEGIYDGNAPFNCAVTDITGKYYGDVEKDRIAFIQMQYFTENERQKAIQEIGHCESHEARSDFCCNFKASRRFVGDAFH